MRRVWQDVRQHLRKQSLQDLHDYLDIHRNLTPFLQRVRKTVIGGAYRPAPAEIIRLEKRDGIFRRIPLPAPADVLLFQTLVQALEADLLLKQPTKNAYYSRSQKRKTIEDVDDSFSYEWWLLWPEFQQRIWEFAAAWDYVVVTDVANYYDTVPLDNLRNSVASLGAFNETVLDFLFFMLEQFTWRPHYIPLTGVGLPQINLEAPRLLAHIYLYPADKELQAATNGEFVRWMDDIDFGTASIADARSILGKLESSLNSIGLRLNSGKTKILNSKDAAGYFWIQENRSLTIAQNLIAHGSNAFPTAARLQTLLRERFRSFVRQPRVGQWEKVYKRYFTMFGRIRDSYLQKQVPTLLIDVPALRESIFRYYLVLGYSPTRLSHLADYLTGSDGVDDASAFQALYLLIGWKMPKSTASRQRVLQLASSLGTAKSPVAPVVGALAVIAKYGSRQALGDYVRATVAVWGRSEWAGRQIAAVTPRLDGPAREFVLHELSTNGLLEGLRVIAHLSEMQKLGAMDKQLKSYLFHGITSGYPYPFPKILIALAILQGSIGAAEKQQIADTVSRIAQDDVYREMLRESLRA